MAAVKKESGSLVLASKLDALAAGLALHASRRVDNPPQADSLPHKGLVQGRPDAIGLDFGLHAGRRVDNPPQAESLPHISDGQFFTFGEVAGALWRRKWLVGMLAVACTAAAVAIAYSEAPVYQAKALIEIQGVNENFLNRRELDPTSSEGGVMLQPYIQTQVKLLQTNSLLNRVANKLGLDTAAEFHPKHAKGDSRQQLLQVMARNLTVRLSGDTHIVEVEYESTNPQMAAAVANTLTNEYVAQNLEKRLSATEYTGKWLTGQLQDLRKTLDQSERELEDYVKTHGVLASPDPSKGTIEDARLRQLEAAYQTARESRINDQSRYEMVASAPLERLPEAIDNETVRAYQTKLTDLNQKLAEARAIYTPAHYKVREIQAQVDEVQHALERERQALVMRLRNQFEASAKREKLLDADLTNATSEVTQETADAVRYNRLKRAVDTYSRLYDNTLEKVKETDLASAVRANNVEVAEAATAPMTPVRPSKPLYSAIGMIFGLLMGSVLALHRDRRNRMVSGPGDCGVRLGIPEFGPIPCASLELPFSVRSSALARPADFDAAAEDGILRNWLEVVTWRQRGSQLAESYRSTLASLMNSMDATAPRVIVFTSAGANEGKTTVVTNLAIALAETGRRVLVIDADRRRPRLHEVFRRSNSYGLSEYLLDERAEMSLGAAVRSACATNFLKKYAQETAVPGLRILTAGMDRSCAPNLVHNRRMADLMAAARLEFDAVLVDTPPLLALSDARGLGRMADGVALVVRADRTPEEVLASVFARLRQDGIRVLGTILNSWKPDRRFGRGYYANAGYAAAAYRRD